MSRIEQAKRKVAVTRYAAAGAAVAAFATFAAAARLSHPGTAHGARTSGTTAQAATTAADESFFGSDSSSNLGPAGSAAPQVQSGGS